MSLIWRQDTSSQFKQTKILLEYQLLSNEWMSNCRLMQLALEPKKRIYIYIYIYIGTKDNNINEQDHET